MLNLRTEWNLWREVFQSIIHPTVLYSESFMSQLLCRYFWRCLGIIPYKVLWSMYSLSWGQHDELTFWVWAPAEQRLYGQIYANSDPDCAVLWSGTRDGGAVSLLWASVSASFTHVTSRGSLKHMQFGGRSYLRKTTWNYESKLVTGLGGDPWRWGALGCVYY